MKHAIVMLLILLQLAGYVSCKKDSTPQTVTRPRQNTAPRIVPGPQLFLTLPNNEVTLNGVFFDAEHNVTKINWEKISGPNSFELENKDSAKTKLSHLIKGEYQFELTVTDAMGQFDKDTIKITVSDLPGNSLELLFADQTWTFPWDAAIEIAQFQNWVPASTSFKVFIKRDTSQAWTEVSPFSINGATASYEYFLPTPAYSGGIYAAGNLFVFYYGRDVSDTPDVKVVL